MYLYRQNVYQSLYIYKEVEADLLDNKSNTKVKNKPKTNKKLKQILTESTRH